MCLDLEYEIKEDLFLDKYISPVPIWHTGHTTSFRLEHKAKQKRLQIFSLGAGKQL
jgi:hypothetical protein